VWIVKKGDQVTVFSSVCPHLGCTINEKPNGFGCVCHNSSWRLTGETSGGPAPRGMDSLEHKVEEGILKVKYQTFKQGLAEKIASS
jgi:Rieske Fe-S protein